MSQQSQLFLDGRVLVNSSMLEEWVVVLNLILPQTSGDLSDQLLDCKTQLVSILNAMPNASIAAGKVILPVDLLNEIKYALAIFEYQFNGFNRQDYFDMVDNVHSVYDQFSIWFYNTNNPSQLMIY